MGICSSAAALVIAVFMRRYVEAPEWFIGASIAVGPMRRAGLMRRLPVVEDRAGCASLTYLGLTVALEHTSIIKMNYS